MLFLAEVKTTSGFSRHVGFNYVCHKWHIQHSSITFGDPENVCCPWNFTDMLFLSEVKTTSGFVART